jgi:hypothetical protein
MADDLPFSSHGRRYYICPRQFVMCLLVIPLAACEPYTYGAGGNIVPYRGSTSATSSRPENCGTPDEPKRCPPYRVLSRKENSTLLPDYDHRTY